MAVGDHPPRDHKPTGLGAARDRWFTSRPAQVAPCDSESPTKALNCKLKRGSRDDAAHQDDPHHVDLEPERHESERSQDDAEWGPGGSRGEVYGGAEQQAYE